ncbi:MAG: biotin--[acetyl-CoA-carboxylase] ligase [Bacteroidaceae bacterium]|nr:biotin--[acetyl-CoA-carboxylase] ligase [Bacteroidaceae bacterium]
MRIETITLEEVGSTNSFLANYHPLRPADITLVTAEHQTAGRGQRGNTWVSEAGKNLLFSLLVRPTELPAAHAFSLSEAIALSIREALLLTMNEDGDPKGGLTVKWPNDIYVDDQKIAGILIENGIHGHHIEHSIIGCGVNVNQKQWTDNLQGWTTGIVPVSLALLLNHEIVRDIVLDRIMNSFVSHYEQLLSGCFNVLHDEYLAALYHREGIHNYIDLTPSASSHEPFQACIVDIEPSGHLVLRDTSGNIRRYAFKEVAQLK